MTLGRALLQGILGIAAAVTLTTLSPMPASAVDPKAYWDGPDAIIIQHPFFSNNEKDSESDIHSIDNSARFTLDRTTRGPMRFIAEGISVTVSQGDNSCTYSTLHFDLSSDNDGTFTASTKYEYALGGSIDGTSGVAVTASKVEGGFTSSLSVDKPCERAFVGRSI